MLTAGAGPTCSIKAALEVYPAGAGEMYSMTGIVSEKLAAGEMLSTTGTVAAQTSGAGEVYSMAMTGADDTVGAEDDFGLIQEVSSLCPPLSPVPDCTIRGIFGRIQEVSNCCRPFPPVCITDRRAYVEVRCSFRQHHP